MFGPCEPARPVRTKLAVLVLLAPLLAAAAMLASESTRAHAIVIVATPPANATIAPGKLEVILVFNFRIDSKRSRRLLQAPDGSEIGVELTRDVEPGTLRGHARVTRTGPWKLRWQVLATDGHITRGEIPYTVAGFAETR